MNLSDLTALATKPVAAVTAKPLAAFASVMNTPIKTRPIYLQTVIDALTGYTLDDAVAGKIVVITGASAGIGETTARRIGAAGGEVVLVARTRENLERVADDIRADGGTAHVYPCDLSDLDAIGHMADQVLADLGRVDILINNAGRSIRRSLELSHDRMHDYQRTMQLNYFAPVQLILKFTPGMRERGFGHIINVSSIGVQTKLPRFGAYIASKSALDGLCDTLQGETVSNNVTFTTVHMPLVRTAMIAPTTMYDRFPTLTPEQAAATLCDAIMHRPRRLSPPSGQLTALTDALSPRPFDLVRNKVYAMFGDSVAAHATAEEAAETVAAE